MKLFSATIASLALMAFSSEGHAQSVATQDASIFGFGNTIDLGFLPVTNSSGVTVYKDVVITLKVDSTGNITYSSTKPTVTLSPTVSPVSIHAGVYKDIAFNPVVTFTLAGPQPVVSGGGAGAWTISMGTSGNSISPYGSPFPAVFYTGPISGYPAQLQNRIKAAGMATATYLGFGQISNSSVSQQPGGCSWYNKGLFGVYVIGAQLIFDSFSSCGTDFKVPQDELSYSLN